MGDQEFFDDVDWVSDEVERVCALIAEREAAGDFGPEHGKLCLEFDRLMTGAGEKQKVAKEAQSSRSSAERDPEVSVAVSSSILSGELATKLQRRRTMNSNGGGATGAFDGADKSRVDRTTGELAGKLQRRNDFNSGAGDGKLPTEKLADADANEAKRSSTSSELAEKLGKRVTIIDAAEEAAAAEAAAAVTATSIGEEESLKVDMATYIHAEAIPIPPPLNQKTPGCFCLFGCGSRKGVQNSFG